MTTPTPELLTVNDIRKLSGLGRNLSHDLARLMPHLKVGRAGLGERLLVRRDDFDRLLLRASQERRDLLELVRDFTPDDLQAWMNAGQGVN
ncbi:hypothetical protein ACMT4L_12010 [Deinococcus sp. A31D244]|uniref:hypothetical protein n=1 Tax=Deinococcus sp. A31D244 TaxID=3397675 RepID=UPI0039DFC92C